MTVTVLAFAGIREILGSHSQEISLPEGATGISLWRELTARHPTLASLEASTRLARNGSLIARGEPLYDGDEVGVLPPFGGG